MSEATRRLELGRTALAQATAAIAAIADSTPLSTLFQRHVSPAVRIVIAT